MQRNQQRKRSVIIALAALPVLWFISPARAQYPAQGQDGHANDANNRVGSGGYNSGTPAGNGVTGNNIVTRNVTGGQGFRGPVPYRDPGAFMGPSGSRFNDGFVKTTTGVPTQFGAPSDLTTPHPFYGEARAVPPPAGSLPEGFNGGYVGTTLTSPSSLSSTLMNAPADYTLQARTLPRTTLQDYAASNPFSYSNIVPPAGTESFINNGSLVTSPLFGIRPMGFGEQNTYNNTMYGTQPGMGDRFRTQESAVQAIQRELMEAAGVRQHTKQEGNGPDSQQNQNPLVQPLDHPLESPDNTPLRDQSVSPSLNNGKGLNSSVNTGAGIRQAFAVPPALQSSQYGALQQRLKQYMGAYGQTDEAANSEFQRQAARRNQAEVTLPNQSPPLAPGRAAPGPRETAPLKIESLATGVTAKGLHDLLASAEEQMRQDKFTAAIEQYDRASRAAPNNPMIQLGRAVAELGGGYYAQAERDLRMAYSSGPALLMAQLDLTKMLSSDRLQFLNNDLSNLTSKNPQDERPLFLQAFLAYNTGNADQALSDLKEAQARGSRADATIRALQQYWSLGHQAPSTQPAQPQLNPPLQTPPAELNK